MLVLFNNINIWVYRLCKFFIKASYKKGSDLNLVTTSNNLYGLLLILKFKSQMQLSQLVDIFVYDTPEIENRFRITYSLLSIPFNARASVSFSSSQINPIISVISLYSSANWLERELWDMFGILIIFNSSLSRILTDYGFKGHPLRKDFPLTGYYETFYNDFVKSVVQSKVYLAQDYRSFTFFNYIN